MTIKKIEYSLSIVAIVAIVGIVSTSSTICFLALHDFNFSGTIDKEKIEVTAIAPT